MGGVGLMPHKDSPPNGWYYKGDGLEDFLWEMPSEWNLEFLPRRLYNSHPGKEGGPSIVDLLVPPVNLDRSHVQNWKRPTMFMD